MARKKFNGLSGSDLAFLNDPLTRDDIDWLNWSANEAIVKAILNGTTYYYGYEVERHCDNDIFIPNVTKLNEKEFNWSKRVLSEHQREKMMNRLIALFVQTYKVDWKYAEAKIRKASAL